MRPAVGSALINVRTPVGLPGLVCATLRAAVIAVIVIFAAGSLPVDSVFEDVFAQPPRRP